MIERNKCVSASQLRVPGAPTIRSCTPTDRSRTQAARSPKNPEWFILFFCFQAGMADNSLPWQTDPNQGDQVMRGFLRRLGGIIGTGLTWAIGWAGATTVFSMALGNPLSIMAGVAHSNICAIFGRRKHPPHPVSSKCLMNGRFWPFRGWWEGVRRINI